VWCCITAAPGAVRSRQPAVRADAEVVRVMCAQCHALPDPAILPRAAWRETIDRMERIRSGREAPPGQAAIPITLPDDMQAALRHYERLAPGALPAPERWPAVAPVPAFTLVALSPPAAPPTPAVSNVELLDVEGDARPELVVCDMRHGMVFVARPYDPSPALRLVAQVPHPSHAAMTDLDRDGRKDLLIADLGEFFPWDHDKGAVVWLRGQDGGRFAPFAIGGLPRVADVEASDVDGDGDLDLIVAAFGYRRTGGLMLLENRTTTWAAPVFAPKVIDPRPGAIHAVPIDLDKDGRMDLVSVIAQEHEQVVAYMNQGGLAFRPQVLYRAPHPNWGSSGIEVVDLDRDGDPDVLLAHGDTFDDSLLKPYHGVEWLENVGGLRFEPHALARMPGAHRARAVDLDGDGDLDVVASAFVADGGGVAAASLASIVWLEQVRPTVFERHTIELGAPRHPTLAVGDVNADGRADVIVGNMATAGASPGWVELRLGRKEE
jgi:hypothetical protein